MIFDCKNMHSKCKAQCCGVVPIPKDIYNSNIDKIVRQPREVFDQGDHVIPLTEDAYCVFLDGDFNCNIYENRPRICRKFGDESHPMLFCPYINKNGINRSRQETRRLTREIEKTVCKLKVLNE